MADGRGVRRAAALVFAAVVVAAGALAVRGQSDEAATRAELMRRLSQVEEQSDADARAAAARGRAVLGAKNPELAAICRKLDTQRIDLDFTDANLYDIIEFIREFARMNIEIHPDVKREGIADRRITIQTKELPLGKVLDQVLRQYGLDYGFEDEVLVILGGGLPSAQLPHLLGVGQRWEKVGPTRIPVPAPRDVELREKLKKTKISLMFTDAPLTDMLAFMAEFSGIDFTIDMFSVQALTAIRMTIKVEELPLGSTLSLMSKMNNFVCLIEDGRVVVISQAEAARRRDYLRGGPPLPSGITSLGKNRQGYEEIRHERSGIVLVRIPAGEYDLGSREDDVGRGAGETRRHVKIERPFLLGKAEVTNAQFRRFADGRKYYPGHSSGVYQGADLDADDQPVVGVTWIDICAYCEWTGLRVPTEEEWEYAARGGDGRIFSWGNAWPPLAGAGNFADAAAAAKVLDGLGIPGYDDGSAATAPVQSFAPNPFGVYDLAGNVWEWCANRFRPREPIGMGAMPDPIREYEESGPVLRGGAWCESRPSALRCARRQEFARDACSPAVGFRVALDCPE